MTISPRSNFIVINAASVVLEAEKISSIATHVDAAIRNVSWYAASASSQILASHADYGLSFKDWSSTFYHGWRAELSPHSNVGKLIVMYESPYMQSRSMD